MIRVGFEKITHQAHVSTRGGRDRGECFKIQVLILVRYSKANRLRDDCRGGKYTQLYSQIRRGACHTLGTIWGSA